MKIHAIQPVGKPTKNVLITNAEFNHTGNIDMTVFGIAYLYSDTDRVELPTGRYNFDFETTVTIAVPDTNALFINSFYTERPYDPAVPVPDVPDMMDESHQMMKELVEEIIKSRGYVLPGQDDTLDELLDDDEVQLDTVSLVDDTAISSLSIEPEPVVTPEPDTVSPQPVVSSSDGETPVPEQG